MKKIKILLSTIVGLLSVCTLATGFTYAWLSTATTVIDFDNAGGGIVSSYFHCGTGDEKDDPTTTDIVEGPYVITRPVHLYNLVELIYADSEYFEVYDKYFQLGYDLDGDGETLEFYNYDSHGVLHDGYTDVLDMGYYSGSHALLPIGQYSEENNYPFAGVFDGSNLTIANLEIKGGDGIDDLGLFGYVTDDAIIHNLYVDNLTINVAEVKTGIHIGTVSNAHPENANVGYIAGHIENANCFENVYVNNSHITGQGPVSINNEWGYYGKCDNAKTLEDFIGRAGVEDPSWGGSVNMRKMYDRLYDIADDYAVTNNNYAFEKDIITRPDNTTYQRDTLTGYAYTYRDREEGSFVFTRYSANAGPLSNYMYLNGGTRYHQIKQTETVSNSGYTIYYNGHYLGVSGTNVVDHNDAWLLQNGKLSIVISSTTYYLNHNLNLVTSTSDTWTKNGNKFYYTTTSGWMITTTTYHYLTYNNGWTLGETTRQNNCTNLTWTAARVTILSESSNGPDYMDYSGTNVTYFPLITEENSYAVTGKNTGYVIGGSEDNTTAAYPNKTGDIRVSKYSTSDIGNSYSDKKLNRVYTIDSSLTTVEINANNYTKYLDSRDGFLDMISDGNIYGLHFMPANININHLVTADYTLINGEEMTNYQMPASSIDFNLTQKGVINFFAGTYFSGNNSFFSLHHIERDENNAISSIKEIETIYKNKLDDRKDYIYGYSDGTYTETVTSNYELVFSTSRIKVRRNNSNWKDDAVYYFEIPVNAGEFALGSVDGGTGAYLMYLDIATNGGIDFNSDVDSFGSVEYRSAPDVAELSMVIITYQQAQGKTVNLTVVYSKVINTTDNTSIDTYNITYSGNIEEIIVTVLSVDIEVYFNGTKLPQKIQSNHLSGTTT